MPALSPGERFPMVGRWRDLVLALVLLLLALPQAGAAALTLMAGDQSRSLRGYLAFLPDPSGHLGFEEVRRMPANAFIPLPGDLSAGYVAGAIWLRFDLIREPGAPEIWWLHLGPRFIDHFDLFVPDASSATSYRHQALDLARPWTQPPDPGHAGLVPLHLPKGGPQTFYLRVANATALQARLELWQPEAFVHWLRLESLWQGGYLITALIIVLMNLFHWYHLREPVFAAYAGYVASFALFMLLRDGTLLLVLQPGTPLPLKWFQLVTQVVLVWFAYRLFATLVKPERFWPRLARSWGRVNRLAVAAGATLVATGAFKLAVPALWVWLLVMIAVNLTSSGLIVVLWRDRSALYFLLIFAVLNLGAMATLLASFGLLPTPSFLVEYGLLAGTLLHWVLIQILLADIFHRVKREHERARDLALAAARQGEAELERQVVEKTRAISALAHRHEVLLMAVGEGIYGVDTQVRTTFINPAAQTMLGYAAEEVLGRNPHALFHARHRDGRPYPFADCPLHRTLEEGRERHQEEWFIRRDGSPLPVAMTCAPLYEETQLIGAVVAFRDISEQKAREVELLELANTDMLTGVANRRFFYQRLEEEIRRLRRGGRREARSALLLMDLDHFKEVNDRFGHAAGDEVLRNFARLARQALRQGDLLGRVGGEEFGALLAAEDAAGALRVAERLRRGVQQGPFTTQAGPIPLTVSIGITDLQDKDQAPEGPLKRADSALYAAKRKGRNRVCVFDLLGD
ncbi:MAG: diguanylate cyclase [Gammaproteobacteria bacterium]|nr:diguanylate cyclase [Gammaproteobacteria bacterium]